MSEQSWVQVNSPYALCCAVSRVVVVGEVEGGGNVPGCFGVDYAVEQSY